MYTKLILFSVLLLGWSLPSYSQFRGDRRPTFGVDDPERGRGRRSGRMDVDDIERLRPDSPSRPDIGRGPSFSDAEGDNRANEGRFGRGEREIEAPVEEVVEEATEDFRRGIRGSDRTIARTSEGRVITCDSDELYVPLSLMKLISESGDGIEIESDINDGSVPNDQKTISIKIPSYLGSCADLKPKIHQDSGSNLVVVTIENMFPLDNYLLGKGKFKKGGAKDVIPRVGVTGVQGNSYTQEDLDEMTTTEKFEACMTINKQLVPNGRGGADLNWPKRKGYKTTLSESIPVEFTSNKNMKVVFGSPKQAARDYGAAFAWDQKSQVSINNPAKCLSFEDMAEGGEFLFDDTDRRYANLQENCEGNFLEVMKGLKKVVDFAEKDLFKDVLERELDNKLEEMAQDRYKRLEGIAKKLNNKNITRDEAERLVQDYLNYVREVDTYYLKPKVDKLRKLVLQKQRGKDLSKSQQNKLDKEILELNKQIGAYASTKMDKKLNSKDTLANLRKLGLTEEAEEIAEFKLYSSYYARVYDRPTKNEKRGQKLSIDSAQSQIYKRLGQYRKENMVYDQAYKAKTGQGNFSRQFAGRIKQSQEFLKKAYTDYQKEEMEAQKACQYSILGTLQNPVKCKRVMDPKEQQKRQMRLQEKVKYYQKKVNADHETYKQFVELERIGMDYKQKQKEQENKKKGKGKSGNLNVAIGGMDDILDSSNPFHFDYEKFADNSGAADNDNFSMFRGKTPSNQGNNSFNMMGSPQMGMQTQPTMGGNFQAGFQFGSQPPMMPMNQGGFPMGGFQFQRPQMGGPGQMVPPTSMPIRTY
ncbi:MAG: hypothetical protein DRQ88_02640 [Epsilonproteobacteria bacterium]|nr:MAG: hypothetical protein DRQ89_02215 [Campylobacterota bacterium]RLA67565.1 MAG: hypothetical protein DRQ88_02640 [Campylobacterota bacterium]